MRSSIYCALFLLCGRALGAPQVSAVPPPSSTALPIVLKELGINDGAAQTEAIGSFSKPGTQLFSHPFFTCWVLGKLLPEKVVTPNSSKYTPLSQINWSKTCWLSPACIVSPTSTSDASKTIKTVSFLRTKFAIRSGGHNANPGFGNVPSDGVLISLDSLNQISLSSDKSTATVGPGNRWGTVYETLFRSGVTVVGGRVSQVGVGGLVLGGGINYFSNQFGFAADGVSRFEVVLAGGKVVNATQTQNADLFWALKGGSSNFGLVIAMDLRTQPITVIHFEVRTYSLNNTARVLDAIHEYQNSGQSDIRSGVTTQFQPDHNLVVFTYTQPNPQAAAAAFKAFDGIPYEPFAPPVIAPYYRLVQSTGAQFSGPPVRDYGRGTTVKMNKAFYKEWYKFFTEEVKKLPPKAAIEFSAQPISESMLAAGDQYGGHAMGIPRERQLWIHFFSFWENASDDTLMRTITNRLEKKTTELAKTRRVHLNFRFMNDCGADQKVLASYGVANLEKLRRVAKKYDKLEVFQRYQNDGFLLRKQ